MATKLLETYKQKIDSLTLVPKGGGCFELSLDGDLAYSKLATGEFPAEEQMVTLVGSRL
ncbi:MAG: SelT/SelW/SelH family protein [Planctomycetales bacterium]|nr:SelT/SelW/SelH family protein [Planctomycetales bacterium]NIM10132.1 SelT/SelW/SelH family protein [Planctomycetales bacterium]NIN08374.1 SelT/SelW/SelH family protein [Planctomycetales bacterium]NIN77502.1 SelT/SelW/SelH family protein [Planctomycetales bacterium]NIO34674.1 SelT/SelW/SelH family protein [Planctomycetales bacterium]